MSGGTCPGGGGGYVLEPSAAPTPNVMGNAMRYLVCVFAISNQAIKVTVSV